MSHCLEFSLLDFWIHLITQNSQLDYAHILARAIEYCADDCRLCMLHGEKEMTDGHDVYGAPDIFKVVVDQFQMTDLEHLDDVLEEEIYV